MAGAEDNLERYHRQMAFAPLGVEGQRRLAGATALVVGVGGLGSWTAELLARAGVGRLRLVDDDRVDMLNLHRQALYDQADADGRAPKVAAAAGRIGRLNPAVAVETVAERLGRENIERLAAGADVILDGTDNFAARFLINDFCVREGRCWVFAGVVGGEAQTMTIVPPRTPCLRCVLDAPPPPCADPRCAAAGVLGPAVAAIASIQAMEAVKLLAGRAEEISPYLVKLDLWTNQCQRIDVRQSCAGVDCPCCKRRRFEYLE